MDLCNLPSSDSKGFGSNAFSTLVKDLAGKERDRQSLELDLKPLSSRKKRGEEVGLEQPVQTQFRPLDPIEDQLEAGIEATSEC